jgi:gliding motility-associated-like protein
MNNLVTKILLSSCLILTTTFTFSQTIRFQNSLLGGLGVATNGLNLSGQTIHPKTAGGTRMSSYSDLVLPPNSTIVKAILYIEGYASSFNQVKFSFPGSGGLQILTPATPGFIGLATTGSYSQFIIDVTNLIPNNGYTSQVIAGGNPNPEGRYAVADITPYSASNYGYGWTLLVAYTNPNSTYRNVTIADNNANFGIGAASTILVPNIIVPAIGPINAIVIATGCWGDPDPLLYPDYIEFGEQGGAKTRLNDPVTGANNDVLNSTVGFSVPNNVTDDGVTGMVGGNYIARNPYNTFAGTSGSSEYFDCDLMDASGILTPNPNPITLEIIQGAPATSNDALGVGAYGISVDIAAAVLTKSLNPTAISDGGVATYTFTIDNNRPGAIDLTGIGFDDIIPAGLEIANPNCAVITGGTGGTLVAAPGTNNFSFTGFNILAGQVATITLCVTNKPGLLNPDCSSNPAAFTNGFSNIQNNTENLANAVEDVCLIITGDPEAGFVATTECFGVATQFTDTSLATTGQTIDFWKWDFGVTPTATSTLQNPTYIYPAPGDYVVRLIATMSNGRSDTAFSTITVLPLPITSTSGDVTICFGDTTQLNASGGDMYAWIGAKLINPNTANPLAHPDNSGQYNVRVTKSTTGCFADDSLNIAVNPLPIPVISGDTIICEGTSTTLTAGGGDSYVWRPGNETTNSITVSPIIDTEYTLVANSLGCLDSVTTTVVIETPPNAGNDGSTEVCNDNNPLDLFSVISGYDIDGTWTNVNSVGNLNTTSGLWNPNLVAEGIYTFDYLTPGINVCPNDTSTASVQVWEVPDITTGTIAPICIGDSIKIPVTISGSKPTFTVVIKEGAFNLTFAGLNPIDTIVFVPKVGKIYTINSVASSGTTVCAKNVIINVPVTFLTPPTISVDSLSCNNINTQYQTYLKFQDGDINSYTLNGTIDVSGISSYISSFINSGSTFKFWITDANGCSPVDTVQGIYACGCASFAGGFNSIPVNYCLNDTVFATHRGNHIMDGNDTLSFVLHDKPGATIGNVIAHKTSPVFKFDPATMSLETTYYIVAVAGDSLVGGLVDLSNPNGCLNISNSLPVIFHDLPTMTMIGDTTICDGQTADLNFAITGKSPFSIDYTANSVANVFNRNGSGKQQVGPLSDSTLYIATKITDGNGCVANTNEQVTVNVNPIPTATLSTLDPSYCFGDSAYLVFSSTGNGPWSIDFTDGSNAYNITTNNAIDSVLVKDVVTTTYTLVQVSDNTNPACVGANNSSVTFTVNPIPTAVLSGSTAICFGSSATINIATSGNPSFLITIDDEGAGFVHNTATDGNSFVVTPTDTTNYTITNIADGSNPTCSSTLTSAVTVAVNPTPTLSVITVNDTICAGDSTLFTLYLTSDGPYDVTYSDGTNSTTLTNVDSAYTFYLSPSENTTYTFNDVTDNDVPAPACSVDPNITKNVVVFKRPTVSFGSDLEICEGDTAFLPYSVDGVNPTYNAYYLFDSNFTEQVFTELDAAGTIPVANLSPGLHTFQLTRANDSSSPTQCFKPQTASIKVQVNPTPRVTISGDTTLCAGETLAIRFNFPTGIPDFDLDLFDGTNTTALNNINNSFVFNTIPTDSVNFSVLNFFDNTAARCAGVWDMSPVTVNVNPIPSVTFTGDDTICIGQPTNLIFQGQGISDFTYYLNVNGSDAGALATDTAFYQQSFTPSITTTYTITQMDDGSTRTCSSFNQGEVTIVVRPLPAAEISGANEVCFGTDVSLNIDVTGYGPFDITYQDQTGTLFQTTYQPHANIYTHSLPVGSHTFDLVSVTMSEDPSCVADPATLTGLAIFRVDPIPVVEFKILDGQTCSPVDATFINNTDAIFLGNCTWSLGDGRTINSCTDTIPNISYVREGSYDVRLTIVAPLSTKCTSSKLVPDAIIVHPDPVADFGYSPEPATIENNTVKLINRTVNGQTYEWTVYNTDGSVYATSNDVSPYVEFPNEDEGEYDVHLYAISPYGCTDEITKVVTVEGVLLVNIPNSFTPNGDGINDFFGPVVYGAYTNEDFSFAIYNRWGEEIFFINNYDPQAAMWDGTFEGKIAQEGSYVYKVVAKSLFSDKIEEFYGEFTLLR